MIDESFGPKDFIIYIWTYTYYKKGNGRYYLNKPDETKFDKYEKSEYIGDANNKKWIKVLDDGERRVYRFYVPKFIDSNKKSSWKAFSNLDESSIIELYPNPNYPKE